jgi:hypothetical protein
VARRLTLRLRAPPGTAEDIDARRPGLYRAGTTEVNRGGSFVTVRRFVVVVAMLALAGLMPSAASPHASGDQIDVCCAWNSALADGTLTYKITGATEALRDAAATGVERWDTAIGALQLTPVSGNVKADVTIKLSRGGSPFVAGQTGRKFQLDRTVGAFFIKGATITIFGARSNDDAHDVDLIAAHEFGHALGANHANASGYLMSTSLDQIPDPDPTACDLDAVEAANEWFFDNDPQTGPAHPSETHVHC